jgi:beta-glucanase (GH16 family)
MADALPERAVARRRYAVSPFFGRLAAAGGALGACLVACGGGSGAPPPWQLVWSDEFDGTALDTTKWSIDIGNGFGTGQQDYDTDRPENVSVANGLLALSARQESYAGQSYTSGRIETSGHFTQAYGRFEASIQIPQGQGMWPAFWLLGDDYAQAGWPQCGEIDVMENRGADPTSVVGSLHGPGGDNVTAGYTLPSGASFSDGFHQFAVEWEPGVVRWYVDDTLYETRSSDTFPRSQPWVFDHPFFVILDLAVGGQFGGNAGASTPFPQSMQVDYVRVYSRAGE